MAESRGDWKAARAALGDWLKHEPGNAAARQRLGKALFRACRAQSRPANELELACQGRRLPRAAGNHHGRGSSLVVATSKKAEEWIIYAEQGRSRVRCGPDGHRPHGCSNKAAATKRRAMLESAAKLDPKSPSIKRLMGLAARQRKDFGQAEQIFEGSRTNAPADAWVRNQLALALVRANRRNQTPPGPGSGRTERAAQNPKAPDSLATLGTVYFRLNRLDDAEKLLAAVFRNGQSQSDDVLALARVEAARGKKDVVVPLLKKALAASGTVSRT